MSGQSVEIPHQPEVWQSLHSSELLFAMAVRLSGLVKSWSWAEGHGIIDGGRYEYFCQSSQLRNCHRLRRSDKVQCWSCDRVVQLQMQNRKTQKSRREEKLKAPPQSRKILYLADFLSNFFVVSLSVLLLVWTLL